MFEFGIMDSITIGKRSYEIPSSWQELKTGQYMRMAPLLAMKSGSRLKDTIALRSAIIFSFLSPRKRITFRDDLEMVSLFDKAEDSNRLQNLLSVVDWVFAPRVVKADIDVEPIISQFKWKKKTYLLPQKNLYDVTVGEWMYIDALMRAYTKTKDHTHLISLVSTVCRPSKSKKERESETYDGFPRIAFNPETIEMREKIFECVPIYVAHAVMDYCSRSAQYLPLRYPKMFKGESTGGKSYGWEGTITELADTGTFGTEKEVFHVLIHKVCRYLVKKMETVKPAPKNPDSISLL